MKTQADFDREIAEMRMEHSISAYNTQIIDEKRKLLEIQRNEGVIREKILELELKIEALRESRT
jgi:hypothetical protein